MEIIFDFYYRASCTSGRAVQDNIWLEADSIGLTIGRANRVSYRTLGKGGFPPPLNSSFPPQESWPRKLISLTL